MEAKIRGVSQAEAYRELLEERERDPAALRDCAGYYVPDDDFFDQDGAG